MASIKISELEEVTKLSTSDVLPIINENKTKKVSLEKLNEILGGSGESGSGSTKMLVIEFDNNLRTFDTDTNKAILTEYYNSIRNDEFVELFVGFNKFGSYESGDNPYWYRATVMIIDDYSLNLYCPLHANTSQSQNVYGINYHEMKELEISASVQISGENYSIVSITHYYNNSWALNGNNKILGMNNTTAFTPTGDYNPATKKYVDDAIANIDIPEGGGGNSGPSYTIYEARDVYSATNSSPLTVSDSSTGGKNILAAAQKAYDNGDYTFKLRMWGTSPSLIPAYIDTVLTLPESGSGAIKETVIYTYVRRNQNVALVSKCYNSHRMKMTNGAVVSQGGYPTFLMFPSTETLVTDTSLTTKLGDYVKTTTMNTELAKKQNILIAGENITIDENNVISAGGGGGGATTESEQRYIRLTGGYNFFTGWSQSYPTFKSEDLAAISEYVTKYYKDDDLKSLLPLTIINNKKSASAPLSEAQVITIHNIYSEFGTIYMEGISYRNNSDQRSGCFSNIYGISIMLLSYTWEDGVFNCTRAGFRNDQISGYLSKGNSDVFTPTGDYNPATKKYVDDAVKNAITSVLEAEY